MGPLLFILYFGPLQYVIKSHGLECMMYADDSQLYITINPACRQSALINLEQCINDIQSFLIINKLTCNPSKTEVVHFSSRFSRLAPITTITFGNHTVASVITSKLDYCNSLMYGLPSTEVQKLQHVHNSANKGAYFF